MCTTIGFQYGQGVVFGRTLELGVKLPHSLLFVPAGQAGFIKEKDTAPLTTYACLGSGFFDIPSFGDGINQVGLMGSSNFYPGYASFAKEPAQGKFNTTTSAAFDYLLSTCRDVAEVREKARNIHLVEHLQGQQPSLSNHFFFMDSSGQGLVLEPREGSLVCHDNPFGILTNSPSFDWHTTNLINYIGLRPENIDEGSFNDTLLAKFGEGTGMLGLPGDFTPPSRFVRAAYFVSVTPKDLQRSAAILQAFRILSQFDIPSGSVVNPKDHHDDAALYTAVMDTQKSAYFIKYHDNINIQSFCLKDFAGEKEIRSVPLEMEMSFG